MARSTRDAWLSGPGDLEEAVVEDVPVKGDNIRVRGLPAAYSSQATSEASEIKVGPNGQQIWTINTGRLEVLQFAHGCVDPKFTVQEAEVIAQKYGPAFSKVVAKIDELSGFDKEAIKETEARFQDGGAGQNGSALEDSASGGGGGSVLPARAGAGAEDAGG